jgi:hypothetical protein
MPWSCPCCSTTWSKAKVSRPPRWSRAIAPTASACVWPGWTTPGSPDGQDPAPTAPDGRFAKDQFPCRPPGRHRDLPGPGHGEDPPRRPRWWPSPVRSSGRRLPAPRRLHDEPPGSGGRHHPHRAELTAARGASDRVWLADYRATRPKVDGKLAQLLRHHGGRSARARGLVRGDPGLQALGCRGEPGPLGQPRAALHRQRLAAPAGLTGDHWPQATTGSSPPTTQKLLQPGREHPPLRAQT